MNEKPVVSLTTVKPVRVRAKITKMGDKVHIIIPRAFYKDIEELIDEFVDLEITKV